MDKRLNAIMDLQSDYACGNFNAKLSTSRTHDEIDDIIDLLNRFGRKMKPIMMSKEYLDQLLNVLPEMVIIVNAKGAILDMNDKVYRQLGYSQDDCLEKTINELHGPDDLFSASWLRNVKNSQEVFSLDSFLTCADGRHLPVHVTVTPLFEPSQSETKIMITAEDTSRKLTDENTTVI